MVKLHYNGNLVWSQDGNKDLSHEEAVQIGKKDKRFYLKYKHYRQIASSAAYMYDNRVNQIVFFTFTIQDNIADNSITNPAFSYALKRFKKDYGLHSYLWVAERQKRGAIHYHCLFDMPFTEYSILKKVWADVGAKFGIKVSRKNSVSGSKNGSSKVNNVEKAIKYITKYIAKGINGANKQSFQGRSYAISRNINVKPKQISVEQAQEYTKVQTREPFQNDYGLTVQFIDTQVVREDWENLKDEKKRITLREKKEKLIGLLRCTKAEAIRSDMYGEALDVVRSKYSTNDEIKEARYTLASMRSKKVITMPYSYYIPSFSEKYLHS